MVGSLVGYLYLGMDLQLHREALNAISSTTHLSIWSFVWLGIFYVLVVLVQTFIFAMVATLVLRLLDGQKATMVQVVRTVYGRKKTLVRYGMYCSGISFLLAHTIGRLPVIGNMASLFSNTTWAVANVFGIPVIMSASEELAPREVSRRSARVLKKGWGEGVTFELSIWLIGIVVLVGSYCILTLLAQPVFAWLGHSVGVTASIASVVVLMIIMECLVFVLLSTIAKVALYRYATTGQADAVFDTEVLRAAVTPRQARKLFS